MTLGQAHVNLDKNFILIFQITLGQAHLDLEQKKNSSV
jgi:hypothetical protein